MKRAKEKCSRVQWSHPLLNSLAQIEGGGSCASGHWGRPRAHPRNLLGCLFYSRPGGFGGQNGFKEPPPHVGTAAQGPPGALALGYSAATQTDLCVARGPAPEGASCRPRQNPHGANSIGTQN